MEALVIWGFPGLPDIERANCFFILLSKDIRHYNICIIYIYITIYIIQRICRSALVSGHRDEPCEAFRKRSCEACMLQGSSPSTCNTSVDTTCGSRHHNERLPPGTSRDWLKRSWLRPSQVASLGIPSRRPVDMCESVVVFIAFQMIYAY